jgi:hypothetical protein
MTRMSRNQVGGLLLLAGGILLLIGGLLHPDQPATLAAYAATDQGMWVMSHWLLVAAPPMVAAGLVILTLRLASAGSGGWSIVGATGVVIAAAGLVSVVAPEAVAFPGLLAARDAGTLDAAAAESAYQAVSANMGGMHIGFHTIFWIAAAILFLSMLADTVWPRWLAYGGTALSIVTAASLFVISSMQLGMAIFALSTAMLVVTGVLLYRLPEAAAGGATHVPVGRMPSREGEAVG